MFDPKCFLDPVIIPLDQAGFDIQDDCLTVSRVRVPGGWLMVSSLVVPSRRGGHYSVALATTLVSDPEHEWLGEDPVDVADDAPP